MKLYYTLVIFMCVGTGLLVNRLASQTVIGGDRTVKGAMTIEGVLTASNVIRTFGAGYESPDGTTALTAGTTVRKCFIMPNAGTIKAFTLTVSPSGAGATWKLWKNTSTTALPTVANSISTAGWPISSNTRTARNTTLSDLSATTFVAQDNICLNLSAISGTPVEATIQVEYQ